MSTKHSCDCRRDSSRSPNCRHAVVA
ncbi:SWIM zinc finger family protein [Microbulbifer agarilyticus]